MTLNRIELVECIYVKDKNGIWKAIDFLYVQKAQRKIGTFYMEEVEEACRIKGFKVTDLMRYPEECNSVLMFLISDRIVKDVVQDKEIKMLMNFDNEDNSIPTDQSSIKKIAALVIAAMIVIGARIVARSFS